MTIFRRLLTDRRAFAAWIVGMTLLMKVLVPGGFMPVVARGALTIQICGGADAAPPAMAAMPHAAMAGMQHRQDGGPDKGGHHGKDMPCAFAGLSAPPLAAVDPLLLAVALAFIVAAVFLASTPTLPRARGFLRPPLRGPPTLA